MKAYLFLLIVTTAVFAQSAADSTFIADTQIELRSYLENDEVPLNKEVVYQVELSWIGDLNRFHILDVGEPVVAGLKLRGSGSSNRFFSDSSGQMRSVKRITYYFTPLEMGMAYIEGITLQYEDRTLDQTETLLAQRLGVKIIEPLPEAGDGLPLGLLFGSFAIIILIIFMILVIRRYQRQKRVAAEMEKPVTMEEKYLAILKGSVNPTQDTPRENLDAMSKLLYSYFSEKLDLPAGTSAGPVRERLIAAGVDEAMADKIRQLLERAELSRFAREEVRESDIHYFYDTVERLLAWFNGQPHPPAVS